MVVWRIRTDWCVGCEIVRCAERGGVGEMVISFLRTVFVWVDVVERVEESGMGSLV
jgi:hypothetical protein